MSKIIDITDKLSFEQNPKLIVKGKEIEVSDRAVDVLKLTPILERGNFSGDAVNEIFKTLFSKTDQEKIQEFSLSFKDFSTLVMSALKMIVEVDAEGETMTPTTT